ncbi:MAG: PP2C family protein-serine/threonine phosphatase [Sedimentisphaerales bacterium]|jgi:sigma-B regulation protein RsbU (phosphoserine phosphatase)
MESSELSRLRYYFDLLAKLIANLNNIALVDDSTEKTKIQRVLKALADILSCEDAFVGKYDEKTQRIVIEDVFSPDHLIHGTFPCQEGSIWNAIIQEQKFYAAGSGDIDSAAKAIGIQNAVVAPFIRNDGTLRIISCCNKRTEMPYRYDTYGSDEGKILQTVAILTARQLDIARSIKIDLEKAARVQKHLLPEKAPAVEKADLDHIYVPAKGVSGDYYDFISLTGHELGIVIGDVRGKGLEAALVMVMIRSSMHSILEQMGKRFNVDEIMFQLNNLIKKNVEEGMFATFIFAVLDTKARLMRYCSAGHLPPMVYRSRRCNFEQTEEISTNLALGVEKNAIYAVHELTLGEGDIVIFCTDGIHEAQQINGDDQFGLERLKAAVIESARKDAKDIIKEILAKMSAFCGGSQLQDDASLIVLKMKWLSPQ